jgi:hypothetical protein
MAYAGTDFTRDLTDGMGIRLESQFSHQASVGDNLLTGDAFDTWDLGPRAATSFRNLIIPGTGNTLSPVFTPLRGMAEPADTVCWAP